MPFIGQTVHFTYGGQCNAALIVDFWEDDGIAYLFVLRRGGPTLHSRVERGSFGEDQRWHDLAECDNVSATKVADDSKTEEHRDGGQRTEDTIRPTQSDLGGTAGAGRRRRRQRSPRTNARAVEQGGAGRP